MPYEWTDRPDGAELRAWPFRSLPRKGFVWFIGLTSVGLALPLLAVLGTATLWGLLPFMALAIGGVWYALHRSYRSGETSECLHLTRDRLHLSRRDPGRAAREWTANPYWVRAKLREGPVEDYLTLTDGNREIELGAFLTPEERRDLHHQILRRLADLR
ncbi:DUF2244 domain-containing protein [Paracoccus sp. (in: a-proteobacteria)]|uniref:DUF2244 domain-containing protein n=1 Tax=Paracoccus sp. TaxID=267 RepID=UPI003A83776E